MWRASGWCVTTKAIEFRRISVGLTDDKMVQVVDGLRIGERIITKGSIFIARPSAGVYRDRLDGGATETTLASIE